MFEVVEARYGVRIDRAALRLGAIIGAVEPVDVVTSSASPWFCGPLGRLLHEPRPLPFRSTRGMQRLFDVPGGAAARELTPNRGDKRENAALRTMLLWTVATDRKPESV